MQPHLDVHASEATALSLLFARYVTGEIADPAWAQMMSLLDESDADDDERIALVNFLSDACTDLGSDAVDVPALVEMEDYVAIMRAA